MIEIKKRIGKKTEVLLFTSLDSFVSSEDFKQCQRIFEISLSKEVRIKNGDSLFADFTNLRKLNHYPENFEDCSVFSNMFLNCPNFNCPIDFDTRNAMYFRNFLRNCEKFNSKITFSNTRKVENFDNFLANCSKFNKKINFTINDYSSKNQFFFGCISMSSENKLYNYKQVDKEKYQSLLLLKNKKDIFSKI